MILPDYMIESHVTIEPMAAGVDRPGVISYGVTSYGYDFRLGYKFKVCNPQPFLQGLGAVLDPKHPDPFLWESVTLDEGDTLTIPPHGFVLAETLETVEIPRNVLGIVVGKSTYARLGLVVNVTPLEPEWRGRVTLELSNTAPVPIVVYPGEGICQCVFYRGEANCKTSYADKRGKYQDQAGVTLPIVKGVE